MINRYLLAIIFLMPCSSILRAIESTMIVATMIRDGQSEQQNIIVDRDTKTTKFHFANRTLDQEICYKLHLALKKQTNHNALIDYTISTRHFIPVTDPKTRTLTDTESHHFTEWVPLVTRYVKKVQFMHDKLTLSLIVIPPKSGALSKL